MGAWQPISRFSRRGFMGYGAASLTAAPALGQSAPPPGGPPGPPAQDTTKVATQSDRSKHLTIAVMVNGKGPFRFVVDTGADRSVIADDIALALGLVHGNQVTVQGIIQNVETPTVRVNEVSFGSFTRQNLKMPILPRALLRADGYLGLDAIDGCRVTFNFADRELKITSPRSGYWRMYGVQNGAVVPVLGSMGHLRAVSCKADGIEATAFIDTGAEVTVGNTPLYNALIENNPVYFPEGTVPLMGVTGGEISGMLTTVHNIRMNSLRFADCVLVIADMQIFDIWGLAKTPALLIGMNYLRQFAKVSIDYGRKEVFFDIASMVIARQG